MAQREIVLKEPIAINVLPGRKYWWCECGLSKKQPFCDSAHKGTEYSPVLFESDIEKTIYFCCCKKTSNRPQCDGSHNNL
jgi:CDGSH-type Zn-finger protein|tara:strand:+ start:269 stop:508 length:240 start_codon:yes stop_codon:yes gene_type:complete